MAVGGSQGNRKEIRMAGELCLNMNSNQNEFKQGSVRWSWTGDCCRYRKLM